MHDKVKELNNKRLKLNLSIACIERELKINRETLRKLSNGTHTPRIDLYFKVKDYLESK